MVHKLTDREWEELEKLIAESPIGRVGVALKRMAVRYPSSKRRLAEQPRSTEGWLVHLALISPGIGFDRALLRELNRLSVH